ncbi:DUF6894 family protein [Bosea sp. PAMC 26642]|uniref:DUF6894 family protein n=1 Tax=Bosea sp. (strain PAMC 26642) TaxID=1792307 RepID=UPI0007701EE6|nr:hypothetical protein [Bosea sp. PAMC 26642]AMJ62767.1 hypothetical protein AXW83_22925 [Bosea sp. PAMC 26642]
MSMARFFFDTHDDGSVDLDTSGVDLPDEAAARDEAQRALSDMVREKLPNSEHLDFGVIVRDEAGAQIYVASLTFVAHGPG